MKTVHVLGAGATCVLVLALSSSPLAAQRMTIGAQAALADYREQGASLRFQGAGAGASLGARYRRFGFHLDAVRLGMEPVGEGAGPAEPFDMTQVGIRLRVLVARAVSLEAGVMSREADPSEAAQAVGGVRLGVHAEYSLAPGAGIALRANYLGATRFSGGGSSPFGVELGLGASYGPGPGRVRITGDFEFQRLDRRTTIEGERMDVPSQSSIARVGVALMM